VRVSSVNQIVERVGQLTGMSDMVRSQVDDVFSNWRSGLANLFDRNAPVDLVITTRGRDDTDVAFAFGAPSMDEVERALANSHRLVPMSNGVRRIEPANDEPSRDSSTQNCFVSPTPRPSVTRIVCSDHAPVAEHVLPYIVRTLTRREVTANAVTLDVSMDAARRSLLGDALQQLDRSRAELDRTLATQAQLDPALRDALAPLAHDVFDLLHGLLTDPHAFTASLTFDPSHVTLHTQLDMHTPDSRLLQALLTAAHPQGPVPPALLAHLLPDGFAYTAGTIDESGLQPTIRQIVQLGEQLIQHDNTLDAADRTALRAALDAIPQFGPVTEALSMGADTEGRPWAAGTMRAANVQPAQWIGSMRAILAALRRPHIQAEIRRLLGLANARMPDLGDLRELPVAGLPAGSLLVQLPSFRALREAAMQQGSSSAPPAPAQHPVRPRRGARAAAEPALQLLLAPEAQDTVVVFGTDARALLQRYNSNTTPGVDPQYVTSPSAALVTALVLNGMPNLLRATSERDARQFTEAMQNVPDHGRTPIVFRMGSSADQQSHLFFDIEINEATVRDIVQLSTRAFAPSGPSTGAPPTGPVTP
jgi:hypothetical protein